VVVGSEVLSELPEAEVLSDEDVELDVQNQSVVPSQLEAPGFSCGLHLSQHVPTAPVGEEVTL